MGIKNAAIFGASLTGLVCYRELLKKDIHVPFFIDNYLPSQKSFSGIDVHRVEAINDKGLLASIDAVIIASSGHAASMRKQLLDMNINKPIIDFTSSAPLPLDSFAADDAGDPNISQTSIYPIDIPKIEFENDLDFLLMDLPLRLLASMPYGLGYVHNILNRLNIRFQTIDIDIITYHRYHSQRILGARDNLYSLPTVDPWDVNNYGKWDDETVIRQYFEKEIEEIVDGMAKARPKIIGISLHMTNMKFAKIVVDEVRKILPGLIVVVGGYSCVHACVGMKVFPEADYMVIGEAETSLEPLIVSLLRGDTVKNIPGVISRFDTQGRRFEPAPLLENLDTIDFPRYDWIDIGLYRNFNGSQTVPILISRGCRWSKCKFCGECFTWRKRSADMIFEELSWLVEKGSNFFFFNESDFNSDPETLLDLCDNIIAARWDIHLSGQLRIHKNSNESFFEKLRKAGFISLNFGVDAWSNNTLRRQMKGYTMEMVKNNLRDCYEAGIRVTANVLIGVPGESDDDIRETIVNILTSKEYISEITAFNVLILAAGSNYYTYPEKYDIHFNGDRNHIYADHPDCIPPELWYSKNPYIDHQVRLNRLKYVVEELKANNVNIGINSLENIARTLRALQPAHRDGPVA